MFMLRSYCFLFCVWMFERHSIVFFPLPSHSKNQYLFRLPNPRVCSKEKRNQSPPVFRVVLKLSQVPPAGKEGKERVRVHPPLFNSRVLQGENELMCWLSLLVVGRGPAGEDHRGEQGEGGAVNGVSGQSEAQPLRYLSQEVCPRHIFKHPTCRWNRDRHVHPFWHPVTQKQLKYFTYFTGQHSAGWIISFQFMFFVFFFPV